MTILTANIKKIWEKNQNKNIATSLTWLTLKCKRVWKKYNNYRALIGSLRNSISCVVVTRTWTAIQRPASIFNKNPIFSSVDGFFLFFFFSFCLMYFISILLNIVAQHIKWFHLVCSWNSTKEWIVFLYIVVFLVADDISAKFIFIDKRETVIKIYIVL